jgi:hypothetical protein
MANGRYRVTYSDGDTIDVGTDAGVEGAKAHANALEAERVQRALKAGINLKPRGLRPDVEVVKAPDHP